MSDDTRATCAYCQRPTVDTCVASIAVGPVVCYACAQSLRPRRDTEEIDRKPNPYSTAQIYA